VCVACPPRGHPLAPHHAGQTTNYDVSYRISTFVVSPLFTSTLVTPPAKARSSYRPGGSSPLMKLPSEFTMIGGPIERRIAPGRVITTILAAPTTLPAIFPVPVESPISSTGL